jgi:hypothetical protein
MRLACACPPFSNLFPTMAKKYELASLDAVPVETNYSERRPNGTYRCRENWNLTRVTLSIPAGTAWSQAQGYDADAAAGGRP